MNEKDLIDCIRQLPPQEIGEILNLLRIQQAEIENIDHSSKKQSECFKKRCGIWINRVIRTKNTFETVFKENKIKKLERAKNFTTKILNSTTFL